MARPSVLALLLVGLLSALARAQDDFDLSDALPDSGKKPTHAPPKRPPSSGDELDLSDALPGTGHNDPAPDNPPKPKPNPKPGSSGGFSDSDLTDGTSSGAGGGSQSHNGEEQADSPGVIPGIVGTVVVAVVGAISSFIAYQKKKLCFKENDQTDVENHPSAKTEPLVQCSLAEK
ncbi:CD99 antigen isoform X2 [Tamandua tetradactyla]|uniref:CD99 antigen isoform X2 n=1 Tax=Tamandua tetradactyla TaxID=48850 RepID=UPI0040540A2F